MITINTTINNHSNSHPYFEVKSNSKSDAQDAIQAYLAGSIGTLRALMDNEDNADNIELIQVLYFVQLNLESVKDLSNQIK